MPRRNRAPSVSADRVVGPQLLRSDHVVAQFDCGVPALNDYLVRQALYDQRSEKTRTYVIVERGSVIGYFSLAAASIEQADATTRLAMGQGAQAIPAILLGRLAVDRSAQGRGLGEALLVEAVTRAASAADTIGARAVLVHAASAEAGAFYTKYGFEPSPTNALHLIMLMKDIRKSLNL